MLKIDICIFLLGTVKSQFKKNIKLQIHLHKAFFSDDWFLDSLHKSFLNQATLNLRKSIFPFLNRELFDLRKIEVNLKTSRPKNMPYVGKFKT